jgi:hypothetical protein
MINNNNHIYNLYTTPATAPSRPPPTRTITTRGITNEATHCHGRKEYTRTLHRQ